MTHGVDDVSEILKFLLIVIKKNFFNLILGCKMPSNNIQKVLLVQFQVSLLLLILFMLEYL